MKKTAVMTFGRMNPPTIGHEKLVDKVKEVAKSHNADHYVILSHSHDSKKNPLSPEQKLEHAKRMFPNTNLSLSNNETPTYLHQAKKLHDAGYRHLVMVVGSDRVQDFTKTLHQYNGAKDSYHFDSIKVVSAGDRDPDAEGVSGMSASKMRTHAKSGNYDAFKQGLPKHMKPEHSKELFDDVSGNLKESRIERLLRILNDIRG